MLFRRLLYSLFLIVLPVLSASPEALYSQENELEKANPINQKAEQLYKQGRYTEALPLAQQSLEIRKKFLALNIRVRQKALTTLPGFIVLLAITPRQAFEKFMDGISINIFLKSVSRRIEQKLMLSFGNDHLYWRSQLFLG
ncbi:MAG: tetratricopeptide repeat protein [Smithellaceae bacterium]|nr:tetratricopeptide repeat protein [Smithellaceae bacterium]